MSKTHCRDHGGSHLQQPVGEGELVKLVKPVGFGITRLGQRGGLCGLRRGDVGRVLPCFRCCGVAAVSGIVVVALVGSVVAAVSYTHLTLPTSDLV